MLECRTCVLRALRAIVGDGLSATATLQRPLALTPHLTTRIPRRRLATAVSERVPEDALSSLERVEQPKLDHMSSHKKGGPIVIHNEKALSKELEYLGDPVKLAQHVDYTLRSDNPTKALDLCRLASRQKMECIVGWNHVIGWHMQAGRTNKAIEIFNEMKKRGQFPDSYTYMRLLHGFPANPELTPKVVSIYNTLFSPTSRVKPNIMHTNAALRVCSLTRDMDALWGIISRLPEHGPNSADATTYTTILQALRHGAMGDEADPMAMAQQRQEAVNEGRRIWQEIIAKWRGGEIIVDEMLVVAMADLLLISRRMQDWDDVLSLVSQTTRLERLVPTLDSPDRHTQHVRRDEVEKELTMIQEDPDGFMPTPSSFAFKAVSALPRDADHPQRPRNLAWVKPGNGILSVAIRACSSMRAHRAVDLYWDALTNEPYNIVPDCANFHALLRHLQLNRKAGRAAKVISRMHDELHVKPVAVTYQIAMSVCARDHKNPNVLDHATLILDDMQKNFRKPEIAALEQYLSLALTTRNGPTIIAALNRLTPFVEKMQKLSKGLPGLSANSQDRVNVDQIAKDRKLAARLFQSMIGAIDTLTQRALIPRDRMEGWNERRNKLNTYLTRVRQDFGERIGGRDRSTHTTRESRYTCMATDDIQSRRERQRLPDAEDGSGGALARWRRRGDQDGRSPKPRTDARNSRRGEFQSVSADIFKAPQG